MKRLEFNPTTITIVTIVALCIAAVIFVISYFTYKKRSANFKQVSSNVVETYTEAFPEAYWINLYKNANSIFLSDVKELNHIKGIYILTNISQSDKVYIGQTTNLSMRIPQHFSDPNKGCPRVYEDVKNGDKFKIQYIVLNAYMPDINQCEAAMIRLLKSDSYYGYNRSLGRNLNNHEVVKSGSKLKEYN